MDYASLGLKCGLEIHQQLSTSKLYCSCPSHIRDDAPHHTVKRRLRASAGETGAIDTAALSEMKKDVYYLYEYYNDTTCLVELDEEPPHEMSKHALGICLMCAKMMHSQILDTAHVMRKTVVDGSNTSGFQRTALIAQEGKIPTSLGDVRIQSICLEEDAAKIVERTPEFTRYNLSKLGIPLIEVSTYPDITTPEHAKEAAAYIGMILRSTKGVLRGIGTIRQDLNVSIIGGERIEIKGAQDLRLIPLWVHNEVLRQQALLELRALLPQNHAFPLHIIDVTSFVASCDSKIIKAVLEKGGKMLGICLPRFDSLLGKEVQPNRRVGSEMSDYAKVAAGVGGIIHSDEKLDKYGMTDSLVQSLRAALKCDAKDAFVLVCAPEAKAKKALEAVHARALMCSIGIPKEVRQPLPDGNSSYMRPIPGADRMYPETDCKSVLLDPSLVQVLPLLDEQKISFAKKYSLPLEQVDALFHEQKEDLMEEIIVRHPVFKPGFVAETLISLETELQRKEKMDTSKVSHEHYRQIFQALEQKKVSKESLLSLVAQAAKNGFLDFSAFSMMDEAQVRNIIKEIAQKHPRAPFNVLMGHVMAQLRGKADGALIAAIVKEHSS